MRGVSLKYTFKRVLTIAIGAVVLFGIMFFLSSNGILTDEIEKFYEISEDASQNLFPFVRSVVLNTLVIFSAFYILIVFKSPLSRKVNIAIVATFFVALVIAQAWYFYLNGFENSLEIFGDISIVIAFLLGLAAIALAIRLSFFKKALKKDIDIQTMMEYLCLLDDQKGKGFLDNLNKQGIIQEDTRQKMLKLVTGTKENPILAAVYTTIVRSNVDSLPKKIDYFLGITHEHLIFAKLNEAFLVVSGEKIALEQVEKYKNKRTVFSNNTVRLTFRNGEKIKIKVYNNFGSVKEQQDVLSVFEHKICGI